MYFDLQEKQPADQETRLSFLARWCKCWYTVSVDPCSSKTLPNAMEWTYAGLSPCDGVEPKEHSLFKMTGGPTLRFLRTAVQQLKMPPRERDTKSHFWHPRADKIPHFDSTTANK